MTPTNKETSPDIGKAPSDTDSSGELIFTPPDSEARFPTNYLPEPSNRRTSPSPLRIASLPPNIKDESKPDNKAEVVDWSEDEEEEAFASDLDIDEDEMRESRPPMHRPTDGQSHQPLLKEEEGRGRSEFGSPNGSARPAFVARRSTFRSRSPSFADSENTTRRKYIYAGFFLLLSLVSFVIQTETAYHIQHTLGWKKAYCMLWLTHGSWSLLWPAQLLILRIQKRKLSWPAFWRRHKYLLRSTAQMVQHQELHLTTSQTHQSPIPYIIKTTIFISTALTIAGASWYAAIDLTTPSDLTAIYNCSAFFAYVFSIMLLNDKLRFDKAVAVAIAIGGVLVVAYGDSKDLKHAGPHGGASGAPPPSQDGAEKPEASSRAIGNIVIGIGSVLYGLYEVLYKKYACPPEGTSAGRGMIFANTVGSLIGFFTLTVLWIPLPILHWTGIEPFELPRGKAAGLLFISTISNAVFSGSFLVLMSLTSPVLSSVAALLTIFLVAITDSIVNPEEKLTAAAIGGGSMIIVAFAMLSWATYREMDQERKKREAEEGMESENEE